MSDVIDTRTKSEEIEFLAFQPLPEVDPLDMTARIVDEVATIGIGEFEAEFNLYGLNSLIARIEVVRRALQPPQPKVRQ